MVCYTREPHSLTSTTDFVVTVILVTSSGVLAPGPLFFGTLLHGTKHGAKAGLASSFGHMVVEFPLVILLALGLITVANQPIIALLIGSVGGVALLVFGVMQIRTSILQKGPPQSSIGPRGVSTSSFVLGLTLTGLNPFFILWWLTVGSKLILDAVLFAGLYGVLILFSAHIWMDYAWLTTVAYAARRGVQLLTARTYRWLLIVFGFVLVYFGVNFLLSAIQP